MHRGEQLYRSRTRPSSYAILDPDSAAGLLLGLINGILVVKLKVLPIVVTMGTWMAYKWSWFDIVGNASLSNLPAAFKVIAQDWKFLGLPFNICVMIVVMVIGICC